MEGSKFKMVTAQLKLSSHRSLRAHLHKTEVYATVISVYAPTQRATTEETDRFFDLVQVTFDFVPEDVLIMVGDWNARVGNTEKSDTDSEWEGVRGYHGVGKDE